LVLVGFHDLDKPFGEKQPSGRYFRRPILNGVVSRPNIDTEHVNLLSMSVCVFQSILKRPEGVHAVTIKEEGILGLTQDGAAMHLGMKG
jgi:hypothetical protein